MGDKMKKLIVAAAMLLITGCGTMTPQQINTAVTIGMTVLEVIEILGSPEPGSMFFNRSPDADADWIYDTRIVEFRNGRVTGIRERNPQAGQSAVQ